MTGALVGRTLAHYHITAALGAGGMGEVYRATDTRLGREVALKVLPAVVAGDPERFDRFQREARALAALDHPGIVTVHSVEEADGVHFLTMQLVAGETLDRAIPEGGMALGRLLAIAVELAEALAAAHAEGIVHRDLKPANVMLNEQGRVKILDFGLAKMSEPPPVDDDETDLPTLAETRAGVVMGTPAYMSPEQIAGRPLDERTDLFSLGILLYEMATGRRPFTGATAPELSASILRDAPREIAALRSDLPTSLDRIIGHCLAKKPDERFPSATELSVELRGLQRTTSAPTALLDAVPGSPTTKRSARSITVVPFAAEGHDKALASLARGLTTDVTAGLCRFSYLSVVGADAATRDSGGGRPEARYVVEGSLRRGRTSLRVNARLLDAASGAHLWAETYDRALGETDLLSAQDEISGRIVATVADSYGVLVRAMAADLHRRSAGEPTAQDWVVRLFAYRQRIAPAEHLELRQGLEHAVEAEPRSPDLHACLAQIYLDEEAFEFNRLPDPLARALAAARRAVGLDRTSQLACQVLAQTHFFRRDLAAFRPMAERAMSINPLDSNTIGILGLMIVHSGEFERGAGLTRRAMELNPNHAGWYHFGPIWEHFHNGEYEQAVERANRVDMPGNFWPYLAVAAACGHLERRSEAAAALRDLLALDPDFAAHARRSIESWHFASGLLEPLLDGLRKAGLEIEEPTRGSHPAAVASAAESRTGTSSSRSAISAAESRANEERFWIAVLPFRLRGDDPSLESLGEDLTEEIITGLSRFSYLEVIARSSTERFADSAADVRSVGEELGARYVLEGSIRQAGSTVRIAAQLVDTASGAHLWAETYDRDLAGAGIFKVQDDVTDRVVATVADPYGVLVRSMARAVRDRPIEQLSAQELVLRVFAFLDQIRPDEHARLRTALEQRLESEPAHADAWACLSLVYSVEHQHRLNPLPNSVERALSAARRAVEADPTAQMGWESLADAAYFARDLGTFGTAAKRAVSLNPRNTSTLALMAMLTAYAGDWDRGVEMTKRAMAQNSNHPGWYHFTLFYDHYRKREYEKALETAKRINMPNFFWTHFVIAAVCGRLGRRDEARTALQALRELFPDDPKAVRESVALWITDREVVDQVMEGLTEAEALVGAPPASRTGRTVGGPSSLASGSSDEETAKAGTESALVGQRFWVAVLPFGFRGRDPSLETLAEGISEEIVTGLSRFSYLRVIARSSTLRYSGQAVDVRAVGRELGARYVMEGSLRQAGARVRIAAQLVDAETGAHLWAESYDRPYTPEAIFDLQDEVVPTIVSTVADMNGILPHAMSEALRGKDPSELTPYEAVLRSFGYLERLDAEEHAIVRATLERTVREAPGDADGWAMLSFVYAEEHKHDFNVLPGSLDRALQAARRAVAAAPSNHLGFHVLAQALFFRRELPAFRNAAERAIALNPMDGCTVAFMGILLAYAGDWEHGCELTMRAMKLNPNHPGWYRFALFNNAYRQRDYRAAVDVALRFNMPSYFYTHAVLAAAYGQLGEKSAAKRALAELLAHKPSFAAIARHELGKWYIDPQLLDEMIDGLRKAGLALDETGPGPESKAPATERAAVAIAVLPFSDLSPAKDQEYLCEGMADEIMNALVGIEGIRVASRTSAFRAAREGHGVGEIARRLSVGHVLEGSVRTAGGSLRVTAQLTDVASGYQLWSERFDREARDIFAVQDEIAGGVVAAVRTRLAPGARAAPARPRVENLEAYRAYLRGRYLRYTNNDHRGAIDCFEEAVRIDPRHGPSWLGVAEVQILAGIYGLRRADEALARAKQALATAEELLGETAETSYVAGAIAFAEYRLDAAERFLRRAVEMKPDYVGAAGWLGMALGCRGRFGEVAADLERACEIDPLAPWPYAMLGFCRLLNGEPEAGEPLADQALAFDDRHTLGLWVRGNVLGALGRFDEAVESFERAVAVSQRGGMVHGMLGWAYAAAGRLEDARGVLDELAARPEEAPTVVPEAWIRARLRDLDGAWAVLDRAFAEGQFLILSATLPGFDPLRDDPRFAELLARLGLDTRPVAEASARRKRSRVVPPFSSRVVWCRPRSPPPAADGPSASIAAGPERATGGTHSFRHRRRRPPGPPPGPAVHRPPQVRPPRFAANRSAECADPRKNPVSRVCKIHRLTLVSS